MEIITTVTITHPDGETRYAVHATSFETAVEKLLAIEKKIQEETESVEDNF